MLGLTRAFFKSGKLAFVDSLADRAGALDAKFFQKMGRLLSLWRFRRGIAAVRCLIYLEAKMRRLRALWKFRRSANIANLVGRSWVRRANEIRYGRAIEVLQAYGRGFSARHLRAKKARGIAVMQKMGRGYLARVYREQAARGARGRAQGQGQGRARAQDPRAQGGDGAAGGSRPRPSGRQGAEEEFRAKVKAAADARPGAARAVTSPTDAAGAEPAGVKPMAFKRTALSDGSAWRRRVSPPRGRT